MNHLTNLDRFIEAQNSDYNRALSEIRNGKKISHWMWYIFPQISGLAKSETSRYYAIKNFDEAQEYLAHSILGKRLIEISNAILDLDEIDPFIIFGSPDDQKLKSCMTLFSILPNTNEVFKKVLDKLYNGALDQQTLAIVNKLN